MGKKKGKEKVVGRWRLCLATSGEDAVRNEYGSALRYHVSSLRGHVYTPVIAPNNILVHATASALPL
jgi:hypothetical protein